VHERVDLQLSLVEGVLAGRDHVAVDDLAHPRVQAHLREGKECTLFLPILSLEMAGAFSTFFG